jgi:glucose-1-phosphate cytidylyltransferase
MKAVILAGGLGTRLSEETSVKPKPMVEIGGKPILWHIMKQYSHYGYNEFVICLGYKHYVVKEWFANYFLHNSDVTIDLKTNQTEIHNNTSEPWKVTLIDTGLDTMTGSRVKKVSDYLNNEPFMLTYGDGVSDIKIDELVKAHKESGKSITVTAYQPEGRFGALKIDDDNNVSSFAEKVDNQNMWINAGFFVCEPEVLDYIEEGRNDVIFERTPVEGLVKDGKMNSFKHTSFWKPMDKLRDKQELEKMWASNEAKWKVWE